MPRRANGTLKSKLVRITAAIMLLMSALTVTVATWTNYATENDHVAQIERHIRDSIASKGATLTESYALALRGMVADNAFTDVARLVSRAPEGDSDVVYGLFLRADGKPWAYVSPTTTGAP